VILIKGKKLKDSDIKLLREFAKFALSKFVSDTVLRESRITIKFVRHRDLRGQDRIEIKRYKAWMHHNGGKNFVITVSDKMIAGYALTQLTRLKQAIHCVGHELVHVKQYLKGEIKDYANGDAGYKGQRYKDWENDENYYFSGWEIEAYGLEEGLYQLFKKQYMAQK
jgi:hypothetical protein